MSSRNFNFGSFYPSQVRYPSGKGCIQSDGWSSMDIQLLNDEHETAILNDLYKIAGTESTPLTTFSYISEYICSNNIDIWPGELISSSNKDVNLNFAERSSVEKRVSRANCMHQHICSKYKRVLESIVTRNDQILALLRQRQYTNKIPKQLS
uniref:Uncharacterized protein n=1 Tax=Anopheles minimus TaxID=112268 RepID=A0A182VVR4_9DIPT